MASMEATLEEILGGLMSPNNERIRECTAALDQAFQNPQTLQLLCQIMVSPRQIPVRQMAAVLINRRLKKQRHWLLVPPEEQAAIKRCMLQALIKEKQKMVRNAIGQLIGTLVHYEAAKKDWWVDILLALIYQRYSLAEPKKSELGSFLFSTLAEATPDLFASQLPETCHLFSGVLMTAQAHGDMATLTVANMMEGMCYLIPLVNGQTAAEQTLANAVPLMLSALVSFAQKDLVAEFSTAIDILDFMVEHVSKLLNPHIQNVVHFCLQMLAGNQFDDSIRLEVLHLVGRIACLKKRAIVKQNLLQPILSVLVEMICSESDAEDVENDYFSGADNTLGASATQTLDLVALHIPSGKLLGSLLPLVEPALQNVDPLRRRGGFMCMAVISEGCSKAIKRTSLEAMVNIIIQRGVVDNDPGVRSVAFAALRQFSVHMQPEITAYAMQILPVLFDFVHQLVVDMRQGKTEGSSMARIFNALEVYCENLEDKIVPHLPVLMERLNECLDQQNIVRMRQLALSCISAVATASQTSFMPYLPTVMDALRPYLVYECNKSMQPLRTQAIDTLSSICRTLGKDNFMHLAQDAMQFSVIMLEQGPADLDVRRAVYSLLGGLAIVLTEDMATVFPRLMEGIMQTVVSTEHETDNQQSADEDDEDSDDELNVESIDYIYAKAEAILTLKEFAANSCVSFSSHLTNSLAAVYPNIDHGHEIIRKTCIEALCVFVIALHNVGNTDGVMRACTILMPKFSELIKNDEDHVVVEIILDELEDLMSAIGRAALPAPEQAEAVVSAIESVLLSNTVCHFTENSGAGDGEIVNLDTMESEFDEVLVKRACYLVSAIGLALDPDSYSLYFGRLYPLVVAKLEKAKRNDAPEQRCTVYDVFSQCIGSLGSRVVTYFGALCPVFLDGTNDSESDAREACFFGLGELVGNCEDKSSDSYPVILQALSNAIARETSAPALDNICGALARLITTNFKLVPLGNVLPVFLSILPIRNKIENNVPVLNAFRVLYGNARASVVGFIGQMASIILHALLHAEFDDDEATDNAIGLVKEIRQDYPELINNVLSSYTSPEVLEFLQGLFN